MAKKRSTTHPYLSIGSFDERPDTRNDKDLFEQHLAELTERYFSGADVTFIEHSPAMFAKNICKGALMVDEEKLQNTEFMFQQLCRAYVRSVEVILSEDSTRYYERTIQSTFQLGRGHEQLPGYIANMRRKHLEAVQDFLEDVARIRKIPNFMAWITEQKHYIWPKGNTDISGLTSSPAPLRGGRFRIPQPMQSARLRKKANVAARPHVDTNKDGLFLASPVPVEIPRAPSIPAEASRLSEGPSIESKFIEEVEITPFQGSDNVDSVRVVSSVDAEIVATPDEEIEDELTISDEVTVDQSLPEHDAMDEDEESTRVTLTREVEVNSSLPYDPTVPQDQLPTEQKSISKRTRTTLPEIPSNKRQQPGQAALESLTPSEVVKSEGQPAPVMEEPKPVPEKSVHFPPARPRPNPVPKRQPYEEPSVIINAPQEKQEKLVLLPESDPADQTQSRRINKGGKWAKRLVVALGTAAAALVMYDYFSKGDEEERATNSTSSAKVPQVPPPPSPTTGPAPSPTTTVKVEESPVPQPAQPPTPRPVDAPVPPPKPEKVAKFDAASVDANNVFLKKLIEDGEFALRHNAGGVNRQFLSHATQGLDQSQRDRVRELNTKLDRGVYAVAMKKFGHLQEHELDKIAHDPTHPDHAFLVSSRAISKSLNQTWTPKVRMIKKNSDGTAVYDSYGKPVFEVLDYWVAYADEYDYGKTFVEEMAAKGYKNVHNVGGAGETVAIEGVTYWRDVLDIAGVSEVAVAGGASAPVNDPKKSTKPINNNPKTPQNAPEGPDGSWHPPTQMPNPMVPHKKDGTYIKPDHNGVPSTVPVSTKYALNGMFQQQQSCDTGNMPENSGHGTEAMRASDRVDRSFMETSASKRFENLFRLGRKIAVPAGETFWNVMKQAIADSGQSTFVKSAAWGTLSQWRHRNVNELPFSVDSQTGDGLILVLDHPDFIAEMEKSIRTARAMDAKSAARRGVAATPETVHVAPEKTAGPLYVSNVYRPREGQTPREALVADIQRSNLSSFVEGAVTRQLGRIKGSPFTVKEIGTRVYYLKPDVKRQLELAAKVAAKREQQGLGNARVNMAFAQPKPVNYGSVLEMNGVETSMTIPTGLHPIDYMEKVQTEKLQARRKKLAENPNNMDLIGRLIDAERQVRAICAGLRRMGLNESVAKYEMARGVNPRRVTWKSGVVERLARVMKPLFEKPEVPARNPLFAHNRAPLSSTGPDTSAIDSGWDVAA